MIIRDRHQGALATALIGGAIPVMFFTNLNGEFSVVAFLESSEKNLKACDIASGTELHFILPLRLSIPPQPSLPLPQGLPPGRTVEM